MIRFVLTVLILFTASCAEPEYPLCRDDDHCRLHESCFDGRCVQCIDDSSCGPGQRCQDGVCQADLDGCDDNGDCQGGQVCLFNLCSSCFEDAQCGPGLRCVDGACAGCASDEDCAPGLVCVQGGCSEPPADEQEPEVVGPEGCTIQPVYFAWDSDVLTDEARKSLDAMVPCLDDGQTHALVGRADDSGDELYNLDLGLRRAQAVKDYLVGEGLPEDKLVVSSAGEKFASSDDAQSRRVDIQ